MADKHSMFREIVSTLEQNTRGVQIGLYTIASLGLAVAIHQVRPISKFSRVSDIPNHFMKRKEVLKGRVVGWEPSTSGPRLLIDHRPPIRIPLWHSSKPPLPVQVWGVKLVGGNGVSWLQCVAMGKEASIVPLSRGSDALVADVTLHLPIIYTQIEAKKKRKKQPKFENLKVGEQLVELGLGVVSHEVSKTPVKADNIWFWLPWLLFHRSEAELLQRAQSRAIAHRAGMWQDRIPSSRMRVLLEYVKSLWPFGSPRKNNAPTVT